MNNIIDWQVYMKFVELRSYGFFAMNTKLFHVVR